VKPKQLTLKQNFMVVLGLFSLLCLGVLFAKVLTRYGIN
jgi:hypothetical protein